MKVSCLMVTLPLMARLPGLRAALAAFAAQSHPDRELIVVMNRGEPAARAAVAAAVGSLGRIVEAPDRLPLGALRNLAVAEAAGDLVCQWDDDDLHHPGRIAGQLAALGDSARAATVLADVMHLDRARRAMRWLNWAATPAGGHPGTLLCRRDAMPAYPERERDEDLALLEALGADVHRQAGAPHLYVYVATGANVTGAAHQAMLADELAISRGLLLRREAALRAGLAAFDFGGAPVAVEGPGGIAFTLRPLLSDQ